MPIPKPFHLSPSRYSLTEKYNITRYVLRVTTLWHFVKFLQVHEHKKADSVFNDTFHKIKITLKS